MNSPSSRPCGPSARLRRCAGSGSAAPARGELFTFFAIGFATALVGLVVTMPLIGYATWHG